MTDSKDYRAKPIDVARRYNVHLNTVYNWLRSDDPPPHRRLGKEYRFNLDDLDEWAASKAPRGDAA